MRTNPYKHEIIGVTSFLREAVLHGKKIPACPEVLKDMLYKYEELRNIVGLQVIDKVKYKKLIFTVHPLDCHKELSKFILNLRNK